MMHKIIGNDISDIRFLLKLIADDLIDSDVRLRARVGIQVDLIISANQIIWRNSKKPVDMNISLDYILQNIGGEHG